MQVEELRGGVMAALDDAVASSGGKKRGSTNRVKESKLIIETNSSSIVSKRSVESKYYPEPHFLRYFVKKRKNRSPLINRGYWLRMKCIDDTVRRFCGQASKPAVVINLGAGFDALFFRLLATEPGLCKSTTFIDVDYDELVQSKVDTILAEEALWKLLGDSYSYHREERLRLVSPQYRILGCDRHDLTPLKRMVSDSFKNGEDVSILLVSEVATCHMEPSEVDELIGWAASLHDVTFCLLEPHLPSGPNHPFAKTMLKHFSNVKTPLRGILRYPTLQDQKDRFRRSGWTWVNAKSLWKVWCAKGAEEIVSTIEKEALDSTEAFDDWEEFALFTCHYFLLIAKSKASSFTHHKFESVEDFPDTGSSPPWVESVVLIPAEDSTQIAPRRFGALYHAGHGRFSYHGGYSTTQTNSTILISSHGESVTCDDPAPSEVEPRLCHTVTKLNERFDVLLVGGRTAQNRALSDAWVRLNGVWKRTIPLPIPLYRHCALQLRLPEGCDAVLIYGGRTKSGKASSEAFLWLVPRVSLAGAGGFAHKEVIEGWTRVFVRSETPMSGRFAAMMVSTMNQPSGLLFGGLEQGGTVPAQPCQSWDLFEDHGEWILSFKNFSQERVSGMIGGSPLPRIGASISSCPEGFTIIGGIGYDGIPAQHGQMMLLLQKSPISVCHDDFSHPFEFEAYCPGGHDLQHLLVGHSAAWDGEKTIVIGGGAICFSFGTYQNQSGICVKDRIISQANFNSVREAVGISPRGNEKELHILAVSQTSKQIDGARLSRQMLPVPSLAIHSSSAFLKVLQDLQPIVLQGLDFGPCTEAWTPNRLIGKIGYDRMVSIHRAETSQMSFQPGSKNFKYIDCQFGQFMESINAGGREYFRALSHKSTNAPANLYDDFPELAEHFHVPIVLGPAAERAHSTVLRISGPVAMWLHYDVLANVLFQVRGTKTLVLFPPSDIPHLSIPPGSSSSTLNVSELLDQRNPMLEHTHPRKIVLSPGDALFIPPLWLHCAIPNDGISVAVNVFFRNLEEGYAPGRDTYGNRDVQAYEEGRKDVAKIVNRFKALPASMADFYLQRLSQELGEHALNAGKYL